MIAERLPNTISKAFLPNPPRVLGVAVSGGSDSMALLHLLKEFCTLHQIELRAVTVDHALRSEAATEAKQVAQHCAQLGVSHDTLVWEDWSGKGNLQKAARDARYAKMAAWAKDQEINTIAVGHTADDQAETFLMRLSRTAGVDGLSGMRRRSVRNGITWVRPLLESRRETLQTYLRQNDIPWVDDPSNDNDQFDRVKARHALRLLSELGINQDVLAEVADHLGAARRALEWQSFVAAKQIVEIDAGAVILDETGLRLQPDEIQRRLLIRALNWVSQSVYAPRRAPLRNMMEALRKGQAGTLDGCHVRRIASKIWVFREYEAVRQHSCSASVVWDNRWQVSPMGPAGGHADLRVRALGLAGLEQCPDWRSSGRPHVVLQSTPAVFQGDTLVAAPLAGHAQNWQAELAGGDEAFFTSLLSH